MFDRPIWWYRVVAGYNSCMGFTWRIVGSHLFFGAATMLVGYGTYYYLGKVPEGTTALSTKAGVVQAGAVILGLFSVLMAALQVRVNATWNKVLSYHTFFGDLITPEILTSLMTTADKCGFKDRLKNYETLEDAHVAAILSDAEHDAVVSCYLNEFEEFCTAVNAGVVDDEYAYKLEGARLIRVNTCFAKYIEKCRTEGISSRRLYVQLEHRARLWNGRKQDEDVRHQARVDKAARKLDSANGMKNIF